MKSGIPQHKFSEIKKILIIGSIGIGNLILFSGVLRRIRALFPQAHSAVIVLKESFKYLFESDPNIDEIIVLDVDKTRTLRDKIRFVRFLRQKRFDLCITTFPSNRLEYNLLAFFSGARYRVAHKYASKRVKTLSFLQNVRIPVVISLHDIEQNCALLTAFGIEPDENDKTLHIATNDAARANVLAFIKNNKLEGRLLVGIHPGSSIERGMILKRWGVQNIALLSDWLFETYNAVVLLFGGKEEALLRQEIISLTHHKPIAAEGLDFLSTAALIGKCTVFISNDSGLMHVSAALGVPTVALFGPTDPGRTAPYGKNHIVVRTGIDCSPCWSVHNLGVGMVRCIYPENYCMTQLSFSMVADAIGKILGQPVNKV